MNREYAKIFKNKNYLNYKFHVSTILIIKLLLIFKILIFFYFLKYML